MVLIKYLLFFFNFIFWVSELIERSLIPGYDGLQLSLQCGFYVHISIKVISICGESSFILANRLCPFL